MTGAIAILLLATGFAACMFWLAWLVANAPEGYEDERGFHLGTPPMIEDRDFGDLIALSHCLECQCWITAPCDWNRCPFKLAHDAGREPTDRLASAPAVSFHSTGVAR